MKKKKLGRAEQPPDPGPSGLCLIGDNFYQAQSELQQLSAALVALVRQQKVPDNRKVETVSDLDLGLLERVREIANSVGRTIGDWAKVTIGELSMIVEEIRAAIGRKQRAFSSQDLE